MIDFTEQINICISGKMSPEEILEFENNLAENEELREHYQILLSAREYIKAKSVLEEIESDPDLPIIMEQVIDHYEGNNGYEGHNGYEISEMNLNRAWYILIPATLFGILLLIKIFIHFH